MPLKTVAAILGIDVKYAYHIIYKWKRAGCVLYLDRRGTLSDNKKFSNDIVA